MRTDWTVTTTLSKTKRVFMVQVPHIAFSYKIDIHLPVPCAKKPLEDSELDCNSTSSKDQLGNKTQAVKIDVQQKQLKQKHTPKTGCRHKHTKPTSSECDEGLTGKCTIEIVQEDKLQIVNHKQKFVKQASLQFGPFDFGEDTNWEGFLDKIAKPGRHHTTPSCCNLSVGNG